MPTIEEARIADGITRAEFAKIIVSYMNTPFYTASHVHYVEGGAPSEYGISSYKAGQCNTFSDLSQAPADLQPYIIKSCELGLMGLEADGQTVKSAFNPNKEMTLAEVSTTMSRLLRGTRYQGSEEWRYQNHLLALQKAEIIPQNIDPMRKELRGNIFIFLMKIKEPL
jgi:hypothetical protein